ncbi:MAG: chromate resistance protein ChrB domain-containing protein [Candidatus Binatia bacterium]
MPDPAESRWLVFIHQIPPAPAYLRVKIGRRLARLGAVAIKNSVYALPRTDQAQEDFQWLRREILEGGGDATICEARFVDGLSDDQLESLFNAARETDYQQVLEEARRLSKSLNRRRTLDEERRTETEAALARLRKRLAEIGGIDFFAASGGEAARAWVVEIEARVSTLVARVPAPRPKQETPAEIRGRTWITRKGVHVDRMASAWLIRRFIDPEARFKFVSGRGYQPEPGEIRFDMFEAEFTHEGDRCTFEVLLERFALADPALRPIAEIVHEIDLKDSKFGRPETVGVDRLIAGIAMSNRDDEGRIAQGATVFEALYEYFRRKRG